MSWSQRAGNSAPNQLPNELWSSKPNGSALREQAYSGLLFILIVHAIVLSVLNWRLLTKSFETKVAVYLVRNILRMINILFDEAISTFDSTASF